MIVYCSSSHIIFVYVNCRSQHLTVIARSHLRYSQVVRKEAKISWRYDLLPWTLNSIKPDTIPIPKHWKMGGMGTRVFPSLTESMKHHTGYNTFTCSLASSTRKVHVRNCQRVRTTDHSAWRRLATTSTIMKFERPSSSTNRAPFFQCLTRTGNIQAPKEGKVQSPTDRASYPREVVVGLYHIIRIRVLLRKHNFMATKSSWTSNLLQKHPQPHNKLHSTNKRPFAWFVFCSCFYSRASLWGACIFIGVLVKYLVTRKGSFWSCFYE